MLRHLSGGYQLDDDPGRLDREAVVRFLTTEAYWHRWRSPDDILRQIDSAWRCVGLYAPDGAQVGFARVVSDGVALGYLADVYVLAEHRGRGLGLTIVREVVDSQPAWRWMLHTADAHALYAKLGFQPAPDTYLERRRP
ncbi:GNAT family N-acetyltransferase [Jatrophihabitans sp.]|uniref:GNAT family N-acetyltransferase n=1 Tax=Jatrophihabitans sp. TaxID=1932789 RepID=UPI002B50B2DA|nr:GNAT family N-acetyltransferase [Jatrophihabitans sp.]